MELLARLKKQQFVSVIWTCLFKFNFLKESRAVLSLGKVCEENGYSYEWHPGQPSYLIKHRLDNWHPQVVPGVQATEHQTKALGDRKPAQAVGDHELHAETEFPEFLEPFTEGLTRTSSSSTDVSPAGVDPICEVCRRTKVGRAFCKKKKQSFDPADRIKIAEKFGEMITTDLKVLNEEEESRLHHRYAVVVQDLATQRVQSSPFKTKSAQETQSSLRKCLLLEESPRSMFTNKFLEFGKGLRRADLES